MKKLLLAVIFGAFLAGCGGGSGSGDNKGATPDTYLFYEYSILDDAKEIEDVGELYSYHYITGYELDMVWNEWIAQYPDAYTPVVSILGWPICYDEEHRYFNITRQENYVYKDFTYQYGYTITGTDAEGNNFTLLLLNNSLDPISGTETGAWIVLADAPEYHEIFDIEKIVLQIYLKGYEPVDNEDVHLVYREDMIYMPRELEYIGELVDVEHVAGRRVDRLWDAYIYSHPETYTPIVAIKGDDPFSESSYKYSNVTRQENYIYQGLTYSYGYSINGLDNKGDPFAMLYLTNIYRPEPNTEEGAWIVLVEGNNVEYNIYIHKMVLQIYRKGHEPATN